MGQAATMRMEDLRLVFGVGIVCVAVLVVFWKPIHMVCFDPEYAKTQGYHPIRVDGLMAGVLVAAVVVGLQAVGVVLMSALVVAPAVAARLFVQRLAPMILLAALFGALAGVLGVTLSTVLSVRDRAVPTGPTIVLMVSAIVGVAMGVHTVIQRRARTLGATV
jgi:manganese/zinc/iron transport system permease protein